MGLIFSCGFVGFVGFVGFFVGLIFFPHKVAHGGHARSVHRRSNHDGPLKRLGDRVGLHWGRLQPHAARFGASAMHHTARAVVNRALAAVGVVVAGGVVSVFDQVIGWARHVCNVGRARGGGRDERGAETRNLAKAAVGDVKMVAMVLVYS